MWPYLDDIVDHIRTFLSIIIIWISTSRDGHIALKGFINTHTHTHTQGASIPGKMNKEKTMSEVEMLEQRKEAERLSNVDGVSVEGVWRCGIYILLTVVVVLAQKNP